MTVAIVAARRRAGGGGWPARLAGVIIGADARAIREWTHAMRMNGNGPVSATARAPKTAVPAGEKHDGAAMTPSPGAQALAPGYVRIGVAQHLPMVLASLGADAVGLIRQAGLEPGLFDDPDNPVTFAALGRLARLGVAETGCQHIGLLVGQLATPSSLGVVGYLAQNSSTVHEALRIVVDHLHLHDRGGAPNLAISADRAIISYALHEPGIESADQIADASIATACNLMRVLCGPDWAPSEVLLPRRMPADPAQFNRFYRAPIRFGQEIAALSFAKSWLDHQPPHADALLRRILAERVKELESASARTVADQLRRLLRSILLERSCSAAETAKLLGLHPRTLNRRLRQEGTAFKRVVDEVRFEIARQLLASTAMSLTQISATLDFSEGSAFTRAFRRWAGETPTNWRVRHGR